MQDTGLIQGISQASQSISFEAWRACNRQLADAISKDRGGRQRQLLHRRRRQQRDPQQRPLPDHAQAARRARRQRDRDHRRLQNEVAGSPGIELFMQPVQDLTIDSTVSRAQYSFILENANPTEFAAWTPRLLERCGRCRRSPTSRAISQAQGQALDLVVDRATAARFGITLATHRQRALRRLRPAHRLDHLYAIEPVSRHPRSRSRSAATSRICRRSICRHLRRPTIGQVPLSAIAHVEQRPAPLLINHFGQFPATSISFNVAPGYSLGAAVAAIDAGEARHRPAAELRHALQGAAAAF